MPMPLPGHFYVPRRTAALVAAIEAQSRRPGRPAAQIITTATWSHWWLIAGLTVSSVAGLIVALAQLR